MTVRIGCTRTFRWSCLIFVALFCLNQANAGLLDDLKEKLKEKIEKEVDDAARDQQNEQSADRPTVVAQSEEVLTPTPIYQYGEGREHSDWSGLEVPEELWTIENGIRIPHPVTLNGRVLGVNALSHYARWNGLGGRNGQIWHALTDYLLLAVLRANPEALDEYLYAYALRFLPEVERGVYPCNPAKPNSGQLCNVRWLDNILSIDRNLDNLSTSSAAEKQQIKQMILSKRNQLLDAAPKLPIKLVDIGNFAFSPYDFSNGGLVLNLGLVGDYKLGPSSGITVHYLYNKNTGGPTSAEDWEAPMIANVKTAGERTVIEAMPYAGVVTISKVGPSFTPVTVGSFLGGFMKVDQEEGQALVDRFGESSYMLYRVNITDMQMKVGEYLWKWKAHMGPIAIYQDKHFKQEPYQVGCESIPGCLVGYQD